MAQQPGGAGGLPTPLQAHPRVRSRTVTRQIAARAGFEAFEVAEFPAYKKGPTVRSNLWPHDQRQSRARGGRPKGLQQPVPVVFLNRARLALGALDRAGDGIFCYPAHQGPRSASLGAARGTFVAFSPRARRLDCHLAVSGAGQTGRTPDTLKGVSVSVRVVCLSHRRTCPGHVRVLSGCPGHAGQTQPRCSPMRRPVSNASAARLNALRLASCVSPFDTVPA